MEHVHYEIRTSGLEKQLIGGIVLTGGGSQLKHMKQLVEYITGMDCRIGYPNEHVSKAPNENMLIPAMSTGVGLVINGLEKFSVSMQPELVAEKQVHDKKATTTLKEKQKEGRGPAGFLNKIKEFFDAEEE